VAIASSGRAYSSNINNQVGDVVKVKENLPQMTLRLTALTRGVQNDLMSVRICSFRRTTDMSFEEALAMASRDEGFKATVYAMNTLLIHKGIYTQEEFQTLFTEWVEKEQRRKAPASRQAESSSAFST